MSVVYDFTGKVVLITGSSAGMGEGIALLFAKSGANVVITGRNAERVAKVAKQCTDVSPKQLTALEVVGNLTNKEDCNRLIETTVQTFGKIDVLVNNAGIDCLVEITDECYYEKFLTTINTNLNIAVYMTHKCVPYLAKTRGNIINIATIGAKRASSDSSPYNISKAALIMFTKCMAAELGPKHHIRVNVVNPGITLTDFECESMGFNREESDRKLTAIGIQLPVGRVGQVSDTASIVGYLASNAAEFITGSEYVADGGQLVGNVFDSNTDY
ncbi:cyclohexanol dehydrogenase-like [Oppia nitens]|uniref:cyclohexanol dehydrogenase-like n=1 Tax=Oppia nitens TaxID=1686743 RepID=UPI0023DB522D|nr:cyclohexanol dehydrogenase-like [Oppia nitens]